MCQARFSRRPGEPREEGVGLARSLIEGRALPGLLLRLGVADDFDLSALARRSSLVICVYPSLGTAIADSADRDRATDWAERERALKRRRYTVIAVSTDHVKDQRWLLDDQLTGLLVVNDPRLLLARDLGLRTMRRGGQRVYAPATLVVEDGRIAKCFDADHDAAAVYSWIASRAIDDD